MNAWRDFTTWGRVGLYVFVAHILLLFFPPIPPIVKGSMWSYVTGYLAVALCTVEVALNAPRLIAAWRRIDGPRRVAIGTSVIAGLAVVAWLPSSHLPDLYARFSREEGLWEPLTTFAYLGAGAVLFCVASDRSRGPRKHLQLVGGVYLLMAAEELDYLGLFGAMIGRVEGVYVGSIHDLVRLAVEGLLTTTVTAVFAVAFVALVLALWRAGYLQPRLLASISTTAEGGWALAGLLILGLAAAAEAGIGAASTLASWEEARELLGALALAVYGLQAASLPWSSRDYSRERMRPSIRSRAWSSSPCGSPYPSRR